MGNNEEGKSSKYEKLLSPAPPDQKNVHVYPDWATMQAYYGPRVAIPAYYNSAVASAHAPHPYIWGPPSPMMQPYGAAYPAFCPPGGVYAHPGVPVGSQLQDPAVQLSPATTTPLSIDKLAKSRGNIDQGFMKKLKEFDGLAMSIDNGKAQSCEPGFEPKVSQSSETEGSSNRSDGNTTGEEQTNRKRSREGTPTTGVGGRGPSVDVSRKPDGTLLTPSLATMLEPKNSSGINGTPQPCAVVPSEAWLLDERELKRERRKQSNRESARKSRLRKQAETEELAGKVESLTAENATLRSEINQLNDKSERLRLENAALLEKLKGRHVTVNTENLLSKVNNKSGSDDRNTDGEGEKHEKTSNTSAKLHQLLDRNPRHDAVAAI